MGAVINGKHTDNWGLTVEEIQIHPPEYELIMGDELLHHEGVERDENIRLKERKITLIVGTKMEKSLWRSFFSEFVGAYHGKMVTLSVDDDPGVYYYGRASIESDVKKSARIGKITMKIQAEPYRYSKDYVTVNMDKTTAKTITVQGDYETPCILEISPTADMIDYTITGIARNPLSGEDEPIKLKNLKTGKKVVIDGEACTILQDGQNKFAEAEMWEFPSLQPGSNLVTCSSALCNVTIKYKPRYI